jgi:hypothetical protein
MTAGRTVNSQSCNWCTPEKYVMAVREFFDRCISLDPCSNEWSIVNADVEWVLPEHDGLKSEWNYPTIYVNPPYGADRHNGSNIRDWIRKCSLANSEFGSEVLALIPVAANTKHWKLFIWKCATAVCFLYDTRLKFLVEGRDEGKGAPMACAMIYWGCNYERFEEIFLRFGAVVDTRSLRNKIIGAPRDQKVLFEEV